MNQNAAIAEAAREPNKPRNNWLNKPESTRKEVLEFPGSVDGPWAQYVHDPDKRGIGTVRYPRVVPRGGECAKERHQSTGLVIWLTILIQLAPSDNPNCVSSLRARGLVHAR